MEPCFDKSTISQEAREYYNRKLEWGLKPGQVFPWTTPGGDDIKETDTLTSLREEIEQLKRENEMLAEELLTLDDMLDDYAELGSPDEIDKAFTTFENLLEEIEETYGTFEQMDHVYSEFAKLQEGKEKTVLIIGSKEINGNS